MTSPIKHVEHHLIENTQPVEVGKLHLFHLNPRQGDVGAIAESLKANGQFRAIVVNRGTKTGRPNEVLAGNHTLLGARKLGWSTLVASFVDVDDQAASRIVAADNRTADLGGYDDVILAKLLDSLEDTEGSGYDDDAVAEILELQNAADDTEDTGWLDEDTSDAGEALERTEAGGSGQLDDVEDEDGAGEEIGEASPALDGATVLKTPGEVEHEWDTAGEWELPVLLDDMLMSFDELPKELHAWCGPQTRTWASDDAWWLWMWGVDSTTAMPDVSRVIVGFYTFDDRFENWWWKTDQYMSKVLNSGIRYMLMPDFSQDHPRATGIYAQYRALHLARYFQSVGVKVVPNLTWIDGDRDYLMDVVVPSLPVGMPMLAIQLQTVKAETDEDKAAVAATISHLQEALDALKPQALLVYHGRQSRTWFEDGTLTFDGPIRMIKSRTDAIADWQKATGQRKRKKTI